MRILVTGSRWAKDEHIWLIHYALQRVVEPTPSLAPHAYGVTLVHGAAPGADTIAAEYAESRGWEVEPYPADWERYGRGAGPRRNTVMAGLGADMCIGFPLPGSKGTWDCLIKAADAGIRCRVYPLSTTRSSAPAPGAAQALPGV